LRKVIRRIVGASMFVMCDEANDHSAQSLDIIPISRLGNEPLDYVVEAENAIAGSVNTGSNLHFPGAHGEEIVRDIYSDITVSLSPF
jgi:hypothetical protein